MHDFDYDMPDNYYFGGGGDFFATPPLGIAVLILSIIFSLILPRKYAIVPFLLAGLLIPLKVGIVVMNLNINSCRILLLAVWIRLLSRGECYGSPINLLDKIVIFSTLVNSIAFVLIWGQFGAAVNRAGFLFTSLGTYFLLRSLIRNMEDVIRVIKVFAAVVIVIAVPMLYEHLTGNNPFSLLGAQELSEIRGGRVRANGPFAHSIIAGTFGVVLVPLFVGFCWETARNRLVGALCITASMIMMIASSSSTPVMSLAAGILALAMWQFRKNMRIVRWGIVAMIAGLQIVMARPIWFLINHVSGLLGGSGWHRSMLIDNFVTYFHEWWLIGTNNNPNWGWSMWDVDNAYVAAGLTGGLLGLILFIAIFVRGYRMIGIARRIAEESGKNERLIWSIGAAFFANSVAYLGIVYYDQSNIAWYALLAIISVIGSYPKSEQLPEPALRVIEESRPV